MDTSAKDSKIALRNIKALLEEAAPGPEDLVEIFRAVVPHIPRFGPLSEEDMSRLRTISHTDPAFVQASINTVGASSNMESLIGRTSDDLRRETDEASRWTAVEDAVRALLHGIAAANMLRRHRIGLTALQTYNAARQLVRSKEHAHLLPHVAEMKRLNRFGKKRPVKAAVPAEAVPAVPPEE